MLHNRCSFAALIDGIEEKRVGDVNILFASKFEEEILMENYI